MRHILIYIVVTFLCLTNVDNAFAALRHSDASDDYHTIANLVSNLVKFTEWQGEKSIALTHSLNLCVFGDNELTVDNMPQSLRKQISVTLSNSPAVENINICHVVFVGNRERNVASIIAASKRKPIITIGKVEGFAAAGGIIEILTEVDDLGLFFDEEKFDPKKLYWKVNERMVEESKLQIDARLLQSALEVIK